MDHKNSNSSEIDFMIRLVEYTKYLYEEEKDRTANFHNIMKTYLAIQTFTIGVVIIKIANIKEILELLKFSPGYPLNFSFILLFLSLFFIFLSFIFTIFVLKIRKFERLCSPKEFIAETIKFEKEYKLLSAINANYVVATERNYGINQKKAKYLTCALILYISGLIHFFLMFIFINKT